MGWRASLYSYIAKSPKPKMLARRVPNIGAEAQGYVIPPKVNPMSKDTVLIMKRRCALYVE